MHLLSSCLWLTTTSSLCPQIISKPTSSLTVLAEHGNEGAAPTEDSKPTILSATTTPIEGSAPTPVDIPLDATHDPSTVGSPVGSAGSKRDASAVSRPGGSAASNPTTAPGGTVEDVQEADGTVVEAEEASVPHSGLVEADIEVDVGAEPKGAATMEQTLALDEESRMNVGGNEEPVLAADD